jgi:hypothetical protein
VFEPAEIDLPSLLNKGARDPHHRGDTVDLIFDGIASIALVLGGVERWRKRIIRHARQCKPIWLPKSFFRR